MEDMIYFFKYYLKLIVFYILIINVFNMAPLTLAPLTLAPLTLTRFLYSKDEVELSLLTSLLKNEDIQIVYYWAYELYYSGFDIFEFLWKIYLDFYYELQPYFVTYFERKHASWKQDHSMIHIAYIVRNMFTLKPSCMVFMMRQYMSKEDTLYPTVIYRFTGTGARPWMQSTNKQFHNLFLAIERHHYENICYYLHKLSISLNEISSVVLRFLEYKFMEYKFMEYKFMEYKEPDNINMHYLLAIIARTLYTKTCVNLDIKKHLYVAPKEEHLQHIRALEEDKVPMSKHGLPQIYNTLMHKRFACIDDTVGAFELARFNWSTHEEFVKEVYFNWEYYAMGSPVWLNRLHTFGGIVNTLEKKIEFLSEGEDGKEGFYNLYAYELDELPKEVQAMSMKPICKTNGKAWYEHVFREHLYREHLYRDNLEADLEALTISDADTDVWSWKY
jgi:hypothetical protein